MHTHIPSTNITSSMVTGDMYSIDNVYELIAIATNLSSIESPAGCWMRSSHNYGAGPAGHSLFR